MRATEQDERLSEWWCRTTSAEAILSRILKNTRKVCEAKTGREIWDAAIVAPCVCRALVEKEESTFPIRRHCEQIPNGAFARTTLFFRRRHH